MKRLQYVGTKTLPRAFGQGTVHVTEKGWEGDVGDDALAEKLIREGDFVEVDGKAKATTKKKEN